MNQMLFIGDILDSKIQIHRKAYVMQIATIRKIEWLYAYQAKETWNQENITGDKHFTRKCRPIHGQNLTI